MITESVTETLFAACRRDDRDFLPSLAQRDAANAAQPWTATRCHRLLRPLLSHLTALRKVEARLAAKATGDDGQRPQSQESERQDGLAVTRKRVRYTYSLKGMQKRRQPQVDRQSSVQADWKQQQHQQQKQQAGRYTCPGEVVVPTPVLNRATKRKRSFSVPSSPIERHTATLAVEAARTKYSSSRNIFGSRSAMKDEWARLRTATPNECHQPYECIFRAVDALLHATSVSSASSKQPRSLLAMCLRKVPQYTAAYEAQEREEALQRGDLPPASSDISFSVYSDLESFGHGATGWPHLRTVVRAHAIDLVATACAEGLLRPAFVRLLIRFLARAAAYDEAESLLRASLSHHTTIPEPADGIDSVFSATDGSRSLCLLAEYTEETGRWSCLFQQLAEFLESGRLPSAWLSTRALRGVWERVIRVSSSSHAGTGVHRASLAFATAAMTRLIYAQPAADPAVCPAPWKAFPTLVSVLGNLAAVAILQQEAVVDADTVAVPGQRQLAILVEACLAGEQTTSRRGRKKRTSAEEEPSIAAKRLVLHLARFLSGFREHDGQADFAFESAAGADQQKSLYDAAMTLIVSVAQSCGRGAAATPDAKPARGYLSELCAQAVDPLASCFSPDDDDDRTQRMLADGAFLLASRTNDLRDLAFAESLGARKMPLGRRATSASPAVQKPSSGPATPTALFAGYRWEEGISEWVIASASPAPAGRQKTTAQSLSGMSPASVSEDDDDDDDDDLLQSVMRRSPSPEWIPPATKRLRHGRHGRRSWPSEEGGRQTILSLVSDGEDETGDGEDSYDEISLNTHVAAPRRERRRRRRTAPAKTILWAMDSVSDDELCL